MEAASPKARADVLAMYGRGYYNGTTATTAITATTATASGELYANM